ncbi:MAG: GGDEF domain-containing protein, partial [Candidatus Omnitrophica bacterium]|nr:GGDEF domain-containing protein [Candidatus Omnitrophota bacterium]
LEQRADEEVLRAKQTYQNIIEEKDKTVAAKTKLEREAAQIFTLYEMTKEITRHFDEQEAFNIFKRKLKENVGIGDCRMADDLAQAGGVPPDYSVFTLKNKEQKLGFLLYKGVAQKDKEKFDILGAQFALAYRRIKLYKEIETLAITDASTGVYTRRYFLERFEEEIKRAQARKTAVSFLMLDVDHFKKVNDQHGHLTGDEVLAQIGGALKESVREIDIAGRYGGEEFCVVLPETDAAGAMLVAERIRKSVAKKAIKAYDATLHVTVSTGIASFPADGKLPEELIDKADWSLYRAKSQGRNCTVAFGMYNK